MRWENYEAAEENCIGYLLFAVSWSVRKNQMCQYYWNKESSTPGLSISCTTSDPSKQGCQQVLSPELAAILNQNKMSDRVSVMKN